MRLLDALKPKPPVDEVNKIALQYADALPGLSADTVVAMAKNDIMRDKRGDPGIDGERDENGNIIQSNRRHPFPALAGDYGEFKRLTGAGTTTAETAEKFFAAQDSQDIIDRAATKRVLAAERLELERKALEAQQKGKPWTI